jgi:hypothetical protein
MDRKEARIALRLTEQELGKVEHIAELRGCTLSEAVRSMVRGTVVKSVNLIEITPTNSNAAGLVLPDTSGIAR